MHVSIATCLPWWRYLVILKTRSNRAQRSTLTPSGGIMPVEANINSMILHTTTKLSKRLNKDTKYPWNENRKNSVIMLCTYFVWIGVSGLSDFGCEITCHNYGSDCEFTLTLDVQVFQTIICNFKASSIWLIAKVGKVVNISNIFTQIRLGKTYLEA